MGNYLDQELISHPIATDLVLPVGATSFINLSRFISHCDELW